MAKVRESYYHDIYESPIGRLLIGASEYGIKFITFQSDAPVSFELIPNTHTTQAVEWLDCYFNRSENDHALCLDVDGTPFQKTVWELLLTVPYGNKRSYQFIADKINGSSARAVGNANGKNPIAIYIPCHRIVGQNGHLVGYAGGINRKAWLLDFESNDCLFLPDV